MPRPIRSVRIHRRTAHKGNWCSESARGHSSWRGAQDFQGIHQMGAHRQPDSLAGRLFCYEGVAKQLCLSNASRIGYFYPFRTAGISNCFVVGEFSIDKGGVGESS